MKANAPENMYIPEKIYLPYKGGKIIGLVKETGTPYKSGVDGNIEYIRANAFIKKARKWFEKWNEWTDLDGIKHCDMGDFKDFRKYMKGE